MSMDHRKKHFVLAALAAAACIPLCAHAADSKLSMPAPSKEQREKMALVHEKMATCLRSDRTIEDCHNEMQSNCSEVMGKEHCQMTEHKMRGHRHPAESDKATAPSM